MEKEKECCSTQQFGEDGAPWEPCICEADVDVVGLYERIYNKAAEITQRDAKLWGLDATGSRGITFMHIDNILKLYGCADLLDDNLP